MSDELDKHEDQPHSEDNTGYPDSPQPLQPIARATDAQPPGNSKGKGNLSEPDLSSAGDQKENPETLGESSGEKDNSESTNESSGDVDVFDQGLLTEHDKAVLDAYKPYSVGFEENSDDDFSPGEGNYSDANDSSLPPVEAPRLPQATMDLFRNKDDGRVYICRVEWPSSGPELRYGYKVEYLGETYYKPQLSRTLEKALLLPTNLVRYGSTRELFDKVQKLFRSYVGVSEKQSALLAYWTFASWFPDVLDFVPRLVMSGSRYAADLLFRVLRVVCRRPVLLADISGAALRSIPIEELMPTLLIRLTDLNKRNRELLDASDRKGYLVANGKELRETYCAKCIYIEQDSGRQPSKSNEIHFYVASNFSLSNRSLPSAEDVEAFQNQLFHYRCYNRDLVLASGFSPVGLTSDMASVARSLGAAIVDDVDLQRGVLELLTAQNEQVRVDRANAREGMVLRAVLSYCHQSNRQQVLAKEIAITVNEMYRDEGESTKFSSESVGHVLKNIGLYTRRLSSSGRGLLLDKSTQISVHQLSFQYDVLPREPECGNCQKLQTGQSREVM